MRENCSLRSVVLGTIGKTSLVYTSPVVNIFMPDLAPHLEKQKVDFFWSACDWWHQVGDTYRHQSKALSSVCWLFSKLQLDCLCDTFQNFWFLVIVAFSLILCSFSDILWCLLLIQEFGLCAFCISRFYFHVWSVLQRTQEKIQIRRYYSLQLVIKMNLNIGVYLTESVCMEVIEVIDVLTFMPNPIDSGFLFCLLNHCS